MKVCDIQKTAKVDELFSVLSAQRDDAWKKEFYENVFDASFACGNPQVFHGPDGFPYFQLFTPEPYKAFDSFCVCNLLEYVTENGLGIAFNPRADGADWVFSYGDLLCHRLFGAFEVGQIQRDHTQTVIEKPTQVLVSAPSEAILPACARRCLKSYIEFKTGDKSPGVFLMDNPASQPARSLVFSMTRESFPDEASFNSFMTHLSWFLPRHYPPTILSNLAKPISQFYPL
ncbi:MAG TPA: hypothetical protein VH251_12305 [Verrucomicrobiae bacterium]|jgi:hypothetical protein|nr:hypothetical protein [Verrucomicrobiae bacterium]